MSVGAGTLSLDLVFKGGAVVYLNGEEIARGYMPDGPVDTTTAARPYPQNAYIDSSGRAVRIGGGGEEADALQPVWLNVAIPADAPAGAYAGTVSVAAPGEAPLRLPLHVNVADWTLPAPSDYTFIEMTGQTTPLTRVSFFVCLF